ncbi:MAG: hypothetical protein V2J02_02665 [Pseudomonadales bacterium]|jgi:hypothetical protein|nr:hypothetical protein [Pseudomonadales bacterium]
MRKSRPLRLKVPARTLAAPTFCAGTPEAIAAWIAGVPATDAEAVCRAALEALAELNACEAEPALRLRRLEALREAACAAAEHLTQRARPGAPGSPEHHQRLAHTAQAVTLALATGYKLTILDALRSGARGDGRLRPGSPGAVLVTAVHRVVTELSRLLLRTLQLYVPAPPRLWDELHQFVLLAEAQRFAELAVKDPTARLRTRSSVAEAYARAALLATAQPNALRFEPLGALFLALEDWTRFTRLTPPREQDPRVLVVDLARDEAPVPARLHRAHDEEELRLLDARALVQRLTNLLGGSARAGTEQTPARPEAVSDALLRHCLLAWSGEARRGSRRTAAVGRLELCVGLPAIQHHAAGGVPFEQQLGIPRQSLAVLDEGDVVVPFTPRTEASEAAPALRTALLVDSAPGGFGLALEGEAPDDLENGVLVGLREGPEQHWSLGVVRWLSRETGGLRAGVELLAPRLEPAGARLRSVRGSGGDWVRALRVPALEVLGQPALLVLPPLPFRSGHKVAVHEGGATQEVRLETLRVTGAGFSLFEYRPIEQLAPLEEPEAVRFEPPETDDVWASVPYRR